ncbi:glycosyltransferase [uncultured Draconibacterium sp.]|uniref:glycosyltransferase n=1 Tax=uncultured Draconibacterium sp. TaxID=1573823 RepID=UPI003216A7B9
MKFILVSVGTRGDMEPFLTLAGLLNKNGHQTLCAFPEQFRKLAEDAGIPFYGLSPKFLELIEGDDAVNLMGGKISALKKLKILIKLYKLGVVVNKELVEQQELLFNNEKPDRVIFNGKSTYPIIWEFLNPGKSFLLSPVPCLIHSLKEYPHIGFKGDYGPFFNQLTYKLSNFGLLKNIQDTTKKIRKPLNIKGSDIKKALFDTKMIYTISPSIFKQPDYWPEHVKVVGYHERNKAGNWKPDDKLLQFIKDHYKLLFFTFGSMTNPEPLEKTKIILEILERNRIPAIINTASGGLIQPENYDSDLVYFVETIPYDWVFSKVFAVIHHGGSGTTHAAIKNGCSTMILPHIIDQFLWNNLMFNAGVGPKGIAVDKLTTENLEPKILDIFQNEEYSKKACDLGESMKQEDLSKELYDILIS